MEFRHGRLVMDVPESWLDRSTVLLVAPLDEQKLPTTSTVGASTEAISVAFVSEHNEDPRQVLVDQADELAKIDLGFEVIADGPFSCGLGDGWSFVQRLTLQNTVVRQLAVACPLGGTMVLATAGSADARFDRFEKQLRGILASMAGSRSGGKR